MRVGGAGANLNSHITSVLEVLYERHSLAGEVANAHFRAYQYRRAIISLRRHPVKITTLQQLEALELPGIRDKIKTKVGQIIQTGTCDAIEHGKPVWEDAVKRFMSVHGVGPAVAKQFYFKGYRTLDDLYVDRLSLLNEAQRMGLLYHEDLQHRIPRAEVSAVYASVKRVAQSIVKDMEVHCTGSYRRGAATCGDIDILLSHPSMTAERAPKFMELLNDQLTCHGLLIANLTRDTSSIKHMGIARLPHVGARARRLDLLWVPHKELGASLLYFTGSDMFNRSMRLLAGRCGYSLSQHGLAAGVAQLRVYVFLHFIDYVCIDLYILQQGKKVNDGVVVAGVTEQEVFDRLGIPFIEPKDREVS
ncbi:hypothetical protein BC828DRAFT_113635 [Blastocladiella britannica]|nr:hypothetical protein BC828DRAFT_113635 [Blastocladiella britannica]